jgi:NAD kinase
MRIAVFSKSINESHQNVYDDFFKVCKSLDVEYFLNKDFNFNIFTKKYVSEAKGIYLNKNDLQNNRVDFVISIGGDGTFLDATLNSKGFWNSLCWG